MNKPVRCGCGKEPLISPMGRDEWVIYCVCGMEYGGHGEAKSILAWNLAMGAKMRERLECAVRRVLAEYARGDLTDAAMINLNAALKGPQP